MFKQNLAGLSQKVIGLGVPDWASPTGRPREDTDNGAFEHFRPRWCLQQRECPVV